MRMMTTEQQTGILPPGEAVAQDVHVLSNLLKSLDASAGGPGPIRNMLSEMGIRAPDVLPSSSAEDDHDGDNVSS